MAHHYYKIKQNTITIKVMNAAIESQPKKAVPQKKQPENTFSALKTTDEKRISGESSTAPANTNIPAVHGANTAYSNGSGQVYNQLQESFSATGDLTHPETQQKEQDYKSTLSIPELRTYNDTKLANTNNEQAPGQTIAPSGGTNTTTAPVQPVKISVVAEKPMTENSKQEQVAGKDEAKEAEAKVPENPLENPGFIALQEQVNVTAKQQQQHAPAGKAAQEAQAAAESPSNERESMAQASQVTTMDAQDPGLFDRDTFKAELKKKIDGMKLPENEEQADDFEKHNNINEVNQQAMGDVAQQKNAASGSIETATAAKPDTGSQPVRHVTKMQPPNTGKAPAAVNVNKAMPAKRDASRVETPIKEQTATIDEQMSANGVTDTMLSNSNEPTFTGALDEKNKAKSQSQEATSQFRANETQQLAQTQNESQAQATQQVSGMHGARKGKLNQVQADKNQTASKDTEDRKEVANKINSIYGATKTRVDEILTALDSTVAYKFVKGSKAAKAAFEKHIADNMAAYKKKRYGDSWYSWKNLRRVKDVVVGLPDEVNKYFVSGREVYIETMDKYITEIADIVTKQLNAAKARIATGKKEVQTYVEGLSPRLRKIGKSAINDIQSKFDALEEDVNNKKDALIDVLAKKYSENVAAIDARIEELKAQNQGLVGMVMNALSGIFAFIIEVKNTLTNLLSKVAQVIGAIISDPIGFFGMLIDGLTQGFSNFTTNIWTHLKTGFFGWLTGAMKGITFTMPEDAFSLKGIFSISMQLLGMGWEAIRAIGAKVVGEPVMQALETGEEIVQVVRKDGIGGLWDYLKDQFQDLKATVMDTIMDIIQSQVIQAGIKWILGLLSPVGAFVKAVMAIIDVVKFFIQRAAQIMELVNAFIDSIAAIASGKVGAVAKAIENALAKAIPVLIGLLASILGISGLADKVLGVIRKIRQRIVAGITKFWNFVKKKGKALLSKVGVGKNKEPIKESKAKQIENDPAKDWDDVQVPFKAEDNHTHTLYFADKGGKTVLMVASTPTPFSKFIDTIKPHKDDERTKKAKEKAIKIASDIAIRKKEDTKGDKTKNKKKKGDIASMTKALSKFVAIIFGTDAKGDLPDSIIKHIPKSTSKGIVAKSMGATLLTRKGVEGTDPQKMNPLYNDLFYRLQDSRTYYVRGHLLNENLHGEGILENLTPLSQDGNTNHLRVAEIPIKTAVINDGAIVDYIIVVQYGRSVPEVSDDELETAGFTSDKDKEIIRKIRKAEQFVPQGLSLKSHYLKKEGDKYVKDKVLVNKSSVINPVDLNLKNYKINSERQVRVSVKYNTPAEIAANSQLTPYQADIIFRAANLVSNLTQFKQIIPKLPNVTTDFVTIDDITIMIEEKKLGSKLRIKKVE